MPKSSAIFNSQRGAVGTVYTKDMKTSSPAKRLILIFLLLMPTLLGMAQHQYDISLLSETDESIQLSVVVYGVKEKQASAMACIDAVQSLIFDGIQGSRRRGNPYVHDEQTSYAEHRAYYDQIFGGGYSSFIIASQLTEKGKTQDKRKYYVVNVNIDTRALKNSLVQHGVTRKFGV